MDLKKVKDHWSFLEEIEAPMWVDLTLEAESNYDDIDDEWFHTSHMFHKCSSKELKSAFSHFVEESESSPAISSSVSRSRGKDYKSKKWVGNNCDLLSNQQHPVKVLNDKSPPATSTIDEEIKPKLSFEKTKRTSISSVSNPSTITSESDPLPQKTSIEVSTQAFGHTGGLLSSLKISLRKSCVTRQASRVEVNNDKRHSGGRKSSSSKSSVGSSSYAGQDVKSSHNKEKQNMPERRNVEKLTEVAKNRIKESFVGKGSNAQKTGINNSRKTALSNATTKPKCQTQMLRGKAKPLLQGRNEQRSLRPVTTKPKEKAVGVGLGKENEMGRKLSVSQKAATKTEPKDRQTGLSRPKEKINNATKGNQSRNASQRVYLR